MRVWAPDATSVELVLTGSCLPMRAADGGWWEAEALAPGARYAFSVDGGPPRPDPRSLSQPDGVDGPSEVVDLGAFEWTDGGWRGVPLRGAVLYELHVGTFTSEGTLDAAIERLPHLVDLGVDAVELMPVAQFSGAHGWGYDGVDLFAVHAAYGGPRALQRFVDACHRVGIGVVLDVVYNHLGPAGNYLSEFGPYFSSKHTTNWGDAINLDGPGSDEVRRFVCDNALMWLRDFHVDGLRLDAVHALVDESATHLLTQLSEEVDALACHVGRPLFLIAESDLNDPVFVRPRSAGGRGMDASWADEWHHALHAVLTGETSGYYSDFGSLDQLAKALRQAWVYDGVWSPHRGRTHGGSTAGLLGHHHVVCTQNHDQVGNRAVGERLPALVSEGRLRIAAALLLTSPFTPMLFQGEEWGATTPFQYFTDHQDPELGKAVSEGRCSEFGSFGWDPSDVPDPQDRATFERSRLDWAEAEKHSTLLEWHRALIALRKARPELSDPRPGSIEVVVVGQGLLVRRGTVAICVNLGTEGERFPVRGRPLLAASEVSPDDEGVVVPPDAVVLIEETRA